MSKEYKIEDIRKYIEDFGYKLISNEYKNMHTDLILQCPEGHFNEVPFHSFKRGNRCAECAGLRRNNINNVKEYIESFGYKLLSNEYKNALTKLELKCPKGHIFEMRYNDFQQGHKCPECYNKVRNLNKKYTENIIDDYIKEFGYKWISGKYKNSKSYLKLQCPEGHIYSVIYNSFQQGHRCPECSNSKMFSKPEKEIVDYVKEHYSGEIIENDRTQIKNYWTGHYLELDVWIPEMKKAIEFNGKYWHNNDLSKWYDEIKKKQSVQKNINLLIIDEKSWINDKMYTLNKIKGFIGI